MIIYKITNKITGKTYVGQTVMGIGRRWSQHATSKKVTPLYTAMRKHGTDNFKIEVICSALSPEYLNELEQYFIQYFNCLAPNGYNLTSGGDSAFSRSEETKIKQSMSMVGHHVSDETRAKIAASLRGRPGHRKGAVHTDEAKAKISVAQIGRVASEETKAKMKAAHTGANAYNAKKVLCIESGVIYSSTGEAAKELNLCQSSVSAVCLGKRRSTGGLTFRFVK